MQLQATGKEAVIGSAGTGAGGTDPDVITLADGRILIVWTETLGHPTDVSHDTDGAIFARILNSNGVPTGDEFQVNDTAVFAHDRPHAVATSDGGFVIGWSTTATFGDSPTDTDTYVRYFDTNGVAVSNLLIDVVPDTPGHDFATDQLLQEIIPLSGNRFAVIMEGNQAYLFDSTGNSHYQMPMFADDIVQLENGNILAAVSVNTRIQLTITDSRFDGPTGIPGIYDPLTFFINGDPTLQKGELELAALRGGGFALAYVEEVDLHSSVLRMAVVSDEAQIEFEADPITRDFAFDIADAEFDMIALAGGGLALALVTKDATSAKGVDILLFDADGSLQTKLQATVNIAGDQANPSLTELPDGRIALAYTDDSDPLIAGEVNPMHIAFFEVTGVAGKFVGTEGNDVLGGVAGNDRIFGLGGDDEIRGREGNDRLVGGDGDDKLLGGDGNDALRGNIGKDRLEGGKGRDGLGGGDGDDRLLGQDGADVLGGGAGADVLIGGLKGDRLKGGAGNDRLVGDAGNDILRGGDGSDTLKGGTGADTFVFVRGQSGSDTVSDFNSAADTIAIHLRGLKESSVTVTNSGGDTEISFGANLITLEDVVLAETDITFDLL